MKKEETAPTGTETKKVATKKAPTAKTKAATKKAPKKLPTEAKAKVDKKSAELTLTKVVKYNYPEDLQGQGAEQQGKRKAWRQKVRNKISKLASAVTKAAEGTPKKVAMAKLSKYEAEVLS